MTAGSLRGDRIGQVRPALPEGPVALVGLGVANTAAARALAARGHDIVLTDDGDPTAGAALADELGCRFVHRPDPDELREVLRGCGSVVATPGLPEAHSAFGTAAALGVPVLSEFDLAAAWDDRALLAVTGTNGKTTVCTLTAAMLEASGVRCAAVGNLEVPLVAAIDDPGPTCFVVEASSFRLARSNWFAPKVGTWLNFAADHLDVHADLDAYRSAKAQIWTNQGEGDVAVHNAEDPVVADAARSVPAGVELQGFTLHPRTAAVTRDSALYHERAGVLRAPDGTALVEVGSLWSSLPHDRRNVLAAAATALAGGATTAGVATAATRFGGLPHRVELVGRSGGVRLYNDSKATTPHATLAALEGFASVVLIAGGRNKGVDLSVLSSARNVVAVVGIGDAAEEVLGAFEGRRSALGTDMADAVHKALGLAGPEDVVLLSPGCASFDWYGSYVERGEDFRRVAAAVADAPEGDGRG